MEQHMARRDRTKFDLKATLYDKKGKILSIGTNSYLKSHPLQAEFSEKHGRPEAIFLHAEIAALTKCKDWSKIHSIHIERYDKQGNPRLAKPCKICQSALDTIGVKKITYTQDQ